VNTNPTTAATRLRRACWGLVLIAVSIWPLFAAVGYARSGFAGILAALLAGGVCGGGALVGLLAAGQFGLGARAVPGILLSMILRMGIPLTACVVLLAMRGPLVEAGALAMILVYYLLMLLAETWFLLRLTAAQTSDKSVSKVS